MHMVLNPEQWMRLHTSYCNRLCAWISPKACDTNRLQSASGYGDLRCFGCNGLHDQVQASDALTHLFQEVLEEVLGAETADNGDEASHPAGLVTDEDALNEELLQMFPELQKFIEEVDLEAEEPRRKVKSSKTGTPKRYAVFSGRCTRCGGYMCNDIERFGGERDDEIYRCFTCGWRTSPAYHWNRNEK